MWIILPVVLALAGILGYVVVRRHRRAERRQDAMRKRLVGQYGEAEPPANAIPLRNPGPPGRIAVGPDGLLVALGRSDQDFRHVLWSDIGHMAPVSGGSFILHISHVGDIAVPGSLGRQIWEAVSPTRSEHS